MRPYGHSMTSAACTFFLLSTLRPGSSQIFGCDGPNIECPSKQAAADADAEVCGYNADGIGVVSFESNVTSEGPLTWTVRAIDPPKSNAHPHRTGRLFYLGTPPSLHFNDVTDFGACTAMFWNLTTSLQLPSGFTDFDNFGCDTVMEPQCVQDVIAQGRNALLRILDDSSYDPGSDGSPCDVVAQRIRELSPPESCGGLINADNYGFGTPLTLASGSGNVDGNYQAQGDCTITSGGPNYQLVAGLVEDTIQYLNDLAGKKANRDWTALYKTGTTPLMTFFYNEPWNNASTGPAPFLSEPEVHMSCLRTVPTADQESGSSRLGTSLLGLSTTMLVISSLLYL